MLPNGKWKTREGLIDHKERSIREFNVNVYLEDDQIIAKELKSRLPNVEIYQMKDGEMECL